MRLRFRPLVSLLALTSAVLASPQSAVAQDFDPAGRHHRPTAPTGPEPSPARPKAAPSQRDAGADNRPAGTSTAALIARYTAIVLAQPTSPFPLQRLAQLYRERDGNVKRLITDLEKRAETPGPERAAARLALAAAYREDGQPEEAAKIYEAAAADRPSDPLPMRALADLALARNDAAVARGYFEKVLPLVQGQDKEQTLRSLIAVALQMRDFDAAKKFHGELSRLSSGAARVRGELGRDLEAMGELERAEAEFRDAAAAATGDNRALAPALRDWGRVLTREHKTKEALGTLKRALAAAGAEAGVRGEIFSLITEVYRAENNLGELIGMLEAEHGGDASRTVSLAALYEETGQVDKALAAYRRALAAGPQTIDVRLKLIHLLQTQGELDQATREYEALIRAAPHNPDYVFELCETLIQRGERPRALALLSDLERRAAGDEDVLVRLADFYERVDEKDKSIAVLARLSSLAPGDPNHLVELGDRFYQQGDKKKAVETWNRIKVVVPNRAKALATLGEVYLDHDMTGEGVEALKEASQLEPQNVQYKKAYAVALERTATASAASALATSRFEDAKTIWEGLLAASRADKNLAREARTHIVTLYSLLHQLEQQTAPLDLRFSAHPPDLEAGRLLAEVQARMHKLSDAERTLRRVTELAPGDVESFLALERIFVLQQNLDGAIEMLQKLVEIDPKRAREFYQRMAQYAAELYRDDDAIKFAARAVQLSPDDADGHKKLGEMYAKKQDND
ncbi:MAG TPA: tetratricopeptide repeat protein, partial [Polyangiaceae bacterium]